MTSRSHCDDWALAEEITLSLVGMFASVALILSFPPSTLGAERPERDSKPAAPSVFEWKFLDVNQINCTIASDGPFADYRRTSSPGLEWPRGSGKMALYTAGIWISGKHVPSDSLRTANMDYATEYHPGPLLEVFNTGTLDDTAPVGRASDPRYRLYKIQRGDTISQDYLEWPGDLGAPYDDINGNGEWDPGVDRPRFYGDQQLWCVMNDVNTARHASLGATPPMGIEVRALFHAVDRPGTLENTMVMEWTIINRSDADYTDLYISLWSDPDLGDGNDDLPGSDSTLGLGYVYNGDIDDRTSQGYGTRPPAAGFVFLAGPLVPGSATDSARLADRWVANFRNLPASSFVFYFGYSFAEIIDPPDGAPEYSPIAHDYQLGKAGTAGEYLRRPDSSFYPLFWCSGDPATGTGDLPETFPLGIVNPQDLRMLISSGPFQLAASDTQYVAGAYLMAQGTDRLNSITLLKNGVQAVRDYYELGATAVPGRLLSVSPEIVIFDTTRVGDSTATHGIALSSVGREPIMILEIEGPDPGSYSMSAPLTPFSLDSGETAGIGLQFIPDTRGYHADSLVIRTDDSSHPTKYVYVDGWGHTMVPAKAGIMYGAGTTFEAIDPSIPEASEIGPLPPGLWGMAVRPGSGVLYTVRDDHPWGSTLYRLCTENLDLVIEHVVPLQQLKAIAFSADARLLAGTRDGRLFEVDLLTGDTTFIGASSVGGYNALTFNPRDGSLWGGAFPAGLTDRDKIFKVNQLTGEASIVGTIGNNRPLLSITFGPDGTLYALQTNQTGENTLWQVDTTTGQGTLLGGLGVLGLESIAMRADQPVYVLSNPATLPSVSALFQNYPNPFNSTTEIRYEIGVSGRGGSATTPVRLVVYDVLGREVMMLVDEAKRPGRHTERFDTRDLASGVYLYRLQAGSFIETRRMVLLR